MSIRLDDYVDREAWIVARCRGGRVLHLGCVGFTDCTTADKIALAREGLHQRLTVAADCVGIDLDRAAVEQLRARGLFRNIVAGDVEQLGELEISGGPFDMVVAGEIIEHLSNPGLMLEGVRQWLKPQVILLVSTPNAMGLPGYLRFLTGRFREG